MNEVYVQGDTRYISLVHLSASGPRMEKLAQKLVGSPGLTTRS